MYEEKNIRLVPTGGSYKNNVAVTMKVLVWVTWIAGFVAGILAGRGLGLITSYGYRNNSFSFVTAVLVWIAFFVAGLVPYAFAEIISLLHYISTLNYKIEAVIAEEEAPPQENEKQSGASIDNIVQTAAKGADQALLKTSSVIASTSAKMRDNVTERINAREQSQDDITEIVPKDEPVKEEPVQEQPVKVGPVREEPVPMQKFCHKCGSKLQDGDMFCWKCGCKIGEG